MLFGVSRYKFSLCAMAGVFFVSKEVRTPHDSVVVGTHSHKIYGVIDVRQRDLSEYGVVRYKSGGSRTLVDFTF